MDESLASRGRLRREPVVRERAEDLPGHPQGVHEPALGPARVDVDAVDRQGHLDAAEGLVLDLAKAGAIDRVGADGAEALDVEPCRALADLLVGGEGDP